VHLILIHEPPPWVSYLQALAVPIIAVVIAAVSAWIAARQMRIADDKLQHDAFFRQYEQRLAVYVATRKFLASGFQGNISEDEIQVYGLCTLGAKFLFDDDNQLYRYLREILEGVSAWNLAKSSIEHSSGEERDEWNRIRDAKLNWIMQQGDDHTGFDVKFRPFLMYKQAKRPWLLRWP